MVKNTGVLLFKTAVNKSLLSSLIPRLSNADEIKKLQAKVSVFNHIRMRLNYLSPKRNPTTTNSTNIILGKKYKKVLSEY